MRAPVTCPLCGHQMVNTGLTTGDLTTCNQCHSLLRFTLKKQLQALTWEQYQKLPYTLKLQIQKAEPHFKTLNTKAA